MIRENSADVWRRLCEACARANRDTASVTIVAISKGRPIQNIQEVISCGIKDIGENRIQEAKTKYNLLRNLKNYGLPVDTPGLPVRWHMVGYLQTNKVRDAVKIFDFIHSVDSLRLAQEIDRQAARINKVQNIFIEVKTSGEATKFGVRPDEAASIVKEIGGLKNVNIKGLMTIAPAVDSPEDARPYFRMLRELRDKINTLESTPYALDLLSMGMTGDFEVAIEEGANIVRLGRAIFED